MNYMQARGKPWNSDISFRHNVAQLTEGVVKRAEALACKVEREQVNLSTYVWASKPTLTVSATTGYEQSSIARNRAGFADCDEYDLDCYEPNSADEDDRDVRAMVLMCSYPVIVLSWFLYRWMYCRDSFSSGSRLYILVITCGGNLPSAGTC